MGGAATTAAGHAPYSQRWSAHWKYRGAPWVQPSSWCDRQPAELDQFYLAKTVSCIIHLIPPAPTNGRGSQRFVMPTKCWFLSRVTHPGRQPSVQRIYLGCSKNRHLRTGREHSHPTCGFAIERTRQSVHGMRQKLPRGSPSFRSLLPLPIPRMKPIILPMCYCQKPPISKARN